MHKRIAAVHDLSGFGRASLTIVSPVLSAMGIQVCPLPTALLSTHTGGFENYHFVDLTEHLQPIIDHWKAENIRFDGIYSGFLGSCRQVEILSGFISDFHHSQQLTVVDPVMGDQGVLYGPYTQDMVEAMKELVNKADIITPNFTEAAFLLGEDPKASDLDNSSCKDWLRRLSSMGPRKVIITSVASQREDKHALVLAYDRDFDQYWKTETEWLPASYPGTGDMFASVITGSLLQGDGLPVAMDRAVGFILQAIRYTYSQGLPEREGVLLEKALPVLQQPALCITREMD